MVENLSVPSSLPVTSGAQPLARASVPPARAVEPASPLVQIVEPVVARPQAVPVAKRDGKKSGEVKGRLIVPERVKLAEEPVASPSAAIQKLVVPTGSGAPLVKKASVYDDR